jgi:hypothetical protein
MSITFDENIKTSPFNNIYNNYSMQLLVSKSIALANIDLENEEIPTQSHISNVHNNNLMYSSITSSSFMFPSFEEHSLLSSSNIIDSLGAQRDIKLVLDSM